MIDTKTEIERLRQAENDPEAAHGIEDELLWEVVQLLVRGDTDAAAELANALQTYASANPYRSRWYA